MIDLNERAVDMLDTKDKALLDSILPVVKDLSEYSMSLLLLKLIPNLVCLKNDDCLRCSLTSHPCRALSRRYESYIRSMIEGSVEND